MIDMQEIVRELKAVVEDAIEKHMKAQPYAVYCAECGQTMTFSKKVDSDSDLMITADVCDCVERAE